MTPMSLPDRRPGAKGRPRLARQLRSGQGRTKTLLSLAGLLLFLLALASCAPGAAGDLSAPACPPATVEPTAEPAPNKIIFALVDRSSSYERFTKTAIDRFADSLPKVVSSGDRVIAAWIGSKSGDPAETFFPGDFGSLDNGRVPLVPPPTYPAQPVPPSAVESRTSVQDLRYREALQAYNCEISLWNKDVKRFTEQWDAEREKAKQDFLASAVPALKGTAVEVDNTGTLIQEAIYEASQVFASSLDGDGYPERKLLIFSDMQEFRLRPPEEIPLALEGVDVIVAMLYCETPALCEQAKSNWTPIFTGAGANSVKFLSVNGTTIDTLGNLLR